VTIASDKFERQIKRIHDLLEQSGSEITWNDHIPDPDNPTQARQIDISIRRDNKLTLVECRLRSRKQDATWIEELIGRRESLRADAVIAVSASGFTTGAMAKAKVFGIILRDILSLTEEEISQWGHKTRVSLIFYEFTDVDIIFIFDSKHADKVTIEDIIKHMLTNREMMHGIFEAAAKYLDNINPKGQPCKFKGYLDSKNELKIAGKIVRDILFGARFRQIKQQLSIHSVVVYDEPAVDALKRNVFIEAVEFGNFEITQSTNNVCVAIDLTAINSLPNCLFPPHFGIHFTRTVTMKYIEFYGPIKMGISLEDIGIGVDFCS
jgi:hypothetical protein